MRLGVFGGTFDPVHTGHLVAAETAREAADLDSVMFVPAGEPWLKDGEVVGAKRDRMRMVELAIEGNDRFISSDMELQRPGPTYSADTLEELRDQRPSDRLFLIVGMDALDDFGRWSRPQRILELATLVGVARPGRSGLARAQLDGIRSGASSDVIVAEGPLLDVSATDLRQRLGRGASVRYLLLEAVERYVYENGLYGTAKVSNDD
jgi:nicotinate-nucleotide adenylyltransferase